MRPECGVRAGSLQPVKGEDGIFFGFKGVKQGGQAGHRQDFVNDLGKLAQTRIATGTARARQQPYQRSQSAAVDEAHFAQMQRDLATITQELINVLMQYVRFTGGDAPATPDDGDLPDFACVQ